MRDLRNHGGEVLDRVVSGESLLITRDGARVAEIRPLRRATISSDDLIARRAALPQVDPDTLRADIDSVVDSTL